MEFKPTTSNPAVAKMELAFAFAHYAMAGEFADKGASHIQIVRNQIAIFNEVYQALNIGDQE